MQQFIALIVQNLNTWGVTIILISFNNVTGNRKEIVLSEGFKLGKLADLALHRTIFNFALAELLFFDTFLPRPAPMQNRHWLSLG